jgi:hypothetical protein
VGRPAARPTARAYGYFREPGLHTWVGAAGRAKCPANAHAFSQSMQYG